MNGTQLSEFQTSSNVVRIDDVVRVDPDGPGGAFLARVTRILQKADDKIEVSVIIHSKLGGSPHPRQGLSRVVWSDRINRKATPSTSGKPGSSRARQIKNPTKRCFCCGQSTGGGFFLPGHDAKLKSLLNTAALDGDLDATIELDLRNWTKVTYPKAAEAFEAAQDLSTEDFLIARAESRWSQ